MDITIQEEPNKGYAIASENGKRAGMMTYSKAGDKLIIIDHTDVDSAFSGKGVGKQMLYKIVEMVRQKNINILPLCPFAASLFKKNMDIHDVLN